MLFLPTMRLTRPRRSICKWRKPRKLRISSEFRIRLLMTSLLLDVNADRYALQANELLFYALYHGDTIVLKQQSHTRERRIFAERQEVFFGERCRSGIDDASQQTS